MKDSEAQTTILAPFNGAVGSSVSPMFRILWSTLFTRRAYVITLNGLQYMARLQMRQSKDSLRQSTAGKSITDRLLQKSIALQSNSV